MGRGHDDSEIFDVDRVGLSGVVDDGVETRQRLEELLRSAKRLPSLSASGGFAQAILDSPRERMLLRSGEAPEIVAALSDLVITGETIAAMLAPRLSEATTSSGRLRYISGIVGLVSDFTPYLVALDRKMHLRQSPSSNETLCGLEISKPIQHDYKLRGSWRSERRCPDCAKARKTGAENSIEEALTKNGIGGQQSLYLDELEETVALALLPFARARFVTASSYDALAAQVVQQSYLLAPSQAVDTLSLLSPTERFSNLFHRTINDGSGIGLALRKMQFEITLGILGKRLLDEHPEVVSERWPQQAEKMQGLKACAERLTQKMIDELAPVIGYQLCFATATLCLFWPEVVKSYLSGRTSLDDADLLVAGTAAEFGIRV